jgi:hypothetical protein
MLKMTSFRHAARAALVCSSVFAFVACSTATYKKNGRSSASSPTPVPESASGDATLQDCPKLRLTGGHGKHGGGWGKHGGGHGKHGGGHGKHGGGHGKDPYVPGQDDGYEPGKDGGQGEEPYVPGHDDGGHGKDPYVPGQDDGGGKDPYVPGHGDGGGKDPYVPGHDDGGSDEPGKGDGDIVVVPTDPENPCTGEEPGTEEPGTEEPGTGEEPSPEIPPTQDLGEEPDLEPGKEPCASCGSYEPGQSPKQGPACGKHGKYCEEGPGQYKGDEPKSGL